MLLVKITLTKSISNKGQYILRILFIFIEKKIRFYGYIINLQEPFCYNHICMLQDIAQDLKAPDKESLSIEISTEPKFGISLISFYA